MYLDELVDGNADMTDYRGGLNNELYINVIDFQQNVINHVDK